MSTPSSSSTAHFVAKLVWNSAVDAELTYDTVFAELKTKFLNDSVEYVCSEAEATDAITPAPLAAVGAALNANATRQSNHDKSVLKVNADARKAMGILMSLFDPDCNAHRSLAGWFAEPLPALVTPLERRRKDFNFRNAFDKWQSEFRPNKQYNLDTILKIWESLSDRDIPFAEFWGKYQKYYKEMEDIGHPPTEEKCYEMLRKSVTNDNLKYFVIQLDLPAGRRIALTNFFNDCLHVVRTHKEFDTGRNDSKRKAHEEPIVGRSVTLQKKPKVNGDSRDTICYRCGESGHFKYNNITGAKCQATVCTLCHSFIGTENHNARGCCSRSNQVFPNGNFSNGNSKSGGRKGNRNARTINPSQGKGKRGKRDAGKEKSSHYGPRSEVSTSSNSSDVPKDLLQVRALLAGMESAYARSRNATARKVTSAEDSD